MLATMHFQMMALNNARLPQQAVVVGRRCLRGRKRQLRMSLMPGDHPDTLDTMHNLAHAMDNAGLHHEAVSTYEECLRGRRTVLGSLHPHTLVTLHCLALALSNAGRLQESVDLGLEVSPFFTHPAHSLFSCFFLFFCHHHQHTRSACNTARACWAPTTSIRSAQSTTWRWRWPRAAG